MQLNPHRYNFTLVSHNAKTGPMPVTMTSKDSCPESCPLKGNGCYASAGRLNITWTRMNDRGLDFDTLIERIKSIPKGRIWRHNQAGDLPGSNDRINGKALSRIVNANAGRQGFTYTHYSPSIAGNAKAISKANRAGFTINLSANTLEQADQFKALNIGPVVALLPSEQRENSTTPAGHKVVVCPNYTHGVQCFDCKLCQRSDRSVIVGFPAHGPSYKKVNAVVNQ